MTVAAIAAVVVVMALAWRSRRRALWRIADRLVTARLPLGSDGIVRGAQPILEGGHQRAVLLLHGFGDTPQSLAHLARRLADAGWSVSAPLLPGHGRTLEAFNRSHSHDWITCAQDAFGALAARYSSVVVCGQSMGAALAIELAATQQLAGLALLAPYIAMPRSGRAIARAWPLVEGVYPVLRIRDERSIHDAQAGAQSLAYGYTTPRLVRELRDVMLHARRQLPAIRTATLIVHSREDNRVPPEDVLRAAALIEHPVKSLHWMGGCGHVLTADYCRDAVASLVIDWFERCRTHERAATTAR
ncbi:MAG: alpha/beta hydrolase [Gemmatimonadaceae bacterium]